MKTTTAPSRLQKVLSGLGDRGFDFSSATEYGEPGYSTDKPMILFADWNSLSKSEMAAIESVAEIEWSDEWIQDDQGRAFRSEPNSYCWHPSWFERDGEVVPYDTLPDDGEDLRDALRDYGFFNYPGDTGVMKAAPSCISRERLLTFASLVEEDLQTGFHAHQTDSPEKTLASLPPGEYLFRISGKGQFDVTWEILKVNED